MDLTTQDIEYILPLNRSGNLLEVNFRYKKSDFQTLAVFLFLAASSFLYHKENWRSVVVSILKLVLFAVLSLIILPFVCVLLFIFAVYRQLIIFIQKVKLGSSYGGILLGPDAIWAVEGSCAKSIINVLMMVKSDKTGKQFYKGMEQKIQETFFGSLDQCSKILATYKKCSGYFILKKNDVTPGDCIKPLNIHSDVQHLEKSDLLELISKISNTSLPKDHSVFWEVYIGTQKVEWDYNQNYYPIVFRVHHALGDGASLLKLLANTLVNKNAFNPEPLLITKSWAYTLQENFKSVITLLQAPFAILMQSAVRKADKTSLHGPLLSGNKILVLSSEKQSFCISSIKEIKKKIPGLRFSDVLFTASSSAFQEYFCKRSEEIPDTITSVIPVYYGYGLDGVLQNSFSVALLDVPIMKKADALSTVHYIKTLKEIHQETTALKCSVDYKVNYWILNVVSKYLPEPLLRPLVESSQSTIVISNLPGPSYVSIFDEYPLEDIAFWIPHRGNTGLGLSILSYQDRLQIGLTVDTALISKKEDAQSIVDCILKEIVAINEVINVSTQVA